MTAKKTTTTTKKATTKKAKTSTKKPARKVVSKSAQEKADKLVKSTKAKVKDNAKKEKQPKKPRFTRDMAVSQAIRDFGKKGKAFTFAALCKASDNIMIKQGAASNPTAWNVNKYGLCQLVNFGVVKANKEAFKYTASDLTQFTYNG